MFQVKRQDDGSIFALKVMKKSVILEKEQTEYMRTERDVLTRVDHPYIVTLHASFQTSNKLYLVLDFINGGHLFFQLHRAGIFEEPLARVYTAEIVLALKHLHSLGIVHRDLKVRRAARCFFQLTCAHSPMTWFCSRRTSFSMRRDISASQTSGWQPSSGMAAATTRSWALSTVRCASGTCEGKQPLTLRSFRVVPHRYGPRDHLWLRPLQGGGLVEPGCPFV